MKTVVITLFNIHLFFSLIINSHARLTDEDVEKKKEGYYLTGLPLINYSSDTGFGYGIRLYLYNNGHKIDPDFVDIPYKTQIYCQYFNTTEGMQYHELNLDSFNIFNTRFRIKTALIYDKMLNSNFYGIGADSAKKGLIDYNDNEYSTYKEYENDFLKINNYNNYKYNKYTRTAPTYIINLYRDIIASFKFLFGFQFRHVDIDPWDGREFKLSGNTYKQTQPTLLTISDPNGIDGGWTNFARIGIAYDTRDFEPDPGNGMYFDYVFEINTKILGSEYDFTRSTAGARFYVSPLGLFTIAGRLAYACTNGDVPFYEMNTFGFFVNRFYGLGGNRTIRGYQQDRFLGTVMTLGNIEIRYSFAEIMPLKQRFNFKILGFIDTGNVFDKAIDPFKKPRFLDYKVAYGGGLVIAWNLNTIIHLYYGMSREDTSISINFGHSLD